MAENRIKVSEEKVRDAIGKLTAKLASMKEHLAQVISKRQQLETMYSGPAATIAINAIKKREAEAQRSIDKVTAQRDKLQEYLDFMNTADTEISNSYQEELNKANDLFS